LSAPAATRSKAKSVKLKVKLIAQLEINIVVYLFSDL
jgi:hypothetical protein